MTRKPPNTDKIQCGTHGKVPWLGDVVCAKCGAVFMCNDNLYPDAPESGLCTCGVRLFPERGWDGKVSGDFSARVCCRECAKRKKASS